MVKFDFEVDFIPLLVGFGISFYGTSAIQDNCFWPYVQIFPLYFHTTFTKNIAHCGKNLWSLVEEAPTWKSIPDRFFKSEDNGLNVLLELLEPHCEYDE